MGSFVREEEGKSITVSYLSGNYKLPNPKVKYTRIEIVQSEPAMPDRLEQAVDNTESTPNDQDDFKIRDVRTWNKYLMTNSEFGVDFLIIRVQTALALPSPLPNNLRPMWEVLVEWMNDMKGRGGIDQENVPQVRTGQRALDDLRMQQGVYRGADPNYLRMIYQAQNDPEDVIGNGIHHSINVQKRRQGPYSRGTSRGLGYFSL